MESFWSGVVAGYGVAIPVGAIAVLIVEAGIRCGFLCAFSAGAGAATADLLFAVAAALVGAALAAVLAPYAAGLRLLSAAVLILLGLWGLRGARRAGSVVAAEPPPGDQVVRTYWKFLGLTVINPMTIVYFASLILGMRVGAGGSFASGLLFAAGAFLASLSWQSLLAGVGAIARHGLPPRFRVATSIVGNLLIVGMGIAVLLRG